MACLENECRQCGHWWSDNRPSSCCPMCGSNRVSRVFDERDDHHDDWEEDNG